MIPKMAFHKYLNRKGKKKAKRARVIWNQLLHPIKKGNGRGEQVDHIKRIR
jgi:hypothetical protein